MTLASKPPREKKCRVCRETYTPSKPLQVVCSPSCALLHAKQKRERERKALDKIERKAIREAKEKIKPRAAYMKETQSAFNAWVRARDADQPCISCGRHHQGKYDAGHYRSVGSNPALRFEPLNCHRQCVPCNQHKSGNAIEYRIGLVARIGAEKVAWLEGLHEPKKYTIEDLQQITAHYRALLRDLKKQQEACHV